MFPPPHPTHTPRSKPPPVAVFSCSGETTVTVAETQAERPHCRRPPLPFPPPNPSPPPSPPAPPPPRSCLELRYPALKVADLLQECPLCRGICSCRKCLREDSFQKPVYSAEQLKEAAHHVLTYAGPQLAHKLAAYDAEVGGRLEGAGGVARGLRVWGRGVCSCGFMVRDQLALRGQLALLAPYLSILHPSLPHVAYEPGWRLKLVPIEQLEDQERPQSFPHLRFSPPFPSIPHPSPPKVTHDGLTLEDVPILKLEDQEKPQCNLCSTNLVDLHRHCDACSWDYCIDCCRDLRMKHEARAKQNMHEAFKQLMANGAEQAVNGVGVGAGAGAGPGTGGAQGQGAVGGAAAAGAGVGQWGAGAFGGLGAAGGGAGAGKGAGPSAGGGAGAGGEMMQVPPGAVPLLPSVCGATGRLTCANPLCDSLGERRALVVADVRARIRAQRAQQRHQQRGGAEGAGGGAGGAEAEPGDADDEGVDYMTWVDGPLAPCGREFECIAGAAELELKRFRSNEELWLWREVAKVGGAGFGEVEGLGRMFGRWLGGCNSC